MTQRAEDRKFHFTYKVTCAYNGRIFYGLHSADELTPKFTGKGTALYESIKDYGKDQHAFVIIKEYPSRKEAKAGYNELKASQLQNPIRPEDKKFHIVYKTTRFDGKFYIGVHSSDELDDKYKGSGIYLSRSLKKYGCDKHQRITLMKCGSRSRAFQCEAIMITDEFLIENPLCMNRIAGGRHHGGRVYGSSVESSNKRSASMKNVWASGQMATRDNRSSDPTVIAKIVAKTTGQFRSEEQRLNLSNGLKLHYSNAENLNRHKIRMANGTVKIKMSLSQKAANANMTDEKKLARKAKMKEVANRPEIKIKKSAFMKERMKTVQPASALTRSKISATKSKACTIDNGITIFQSQTKLIEALGSGKSGSRSPNFKYVI